MGKWKTSGEMVGLVLATVVVLAVGDDACYTHYTNCVSDKSAATKNWADALKGKEEFRTFCREHEDPHPGKGVWACVKKKLLDGGTPAKEGGKNWELLADDVGGWCLKTVGPSSHNYAKLRPITRVYDYLCKVILRHSNKPQLDFLQCLASKKGDCVDPDNPDHAKCRQSCSREKGGGGGSTGGDTGDDNDDKDNDNKEDKERKDTPGNPSANTVFSPFLLSILPILLFRP